MDKLAILIPVLRRPKNIQPLVASIESSTPEPYEVVFIASPGDTEEIKELENQNQSRIIMGENYENNGDYARKINTAFNLIEAEWYFLGADDIRFHENWFEEAMKIYKETGACVIGTNDMGNPLVVKGLHSTHTLVLGEYIRECGTIDEPGKVLYEGYSHNYCDTELIETAKWRGAWCFSKNSVVKHYHPDWGLAPRDKVYDIGKKNMHRDGELYTKRSNLWR